MKEEKPFYLRHKEDEGVDEIHLKVQERYKTSGMSGDEWRFNYKIQFKFKGLVVREEIYNGFQFAAGAIPYLLGTITGTREYPFDAIHQLIEKKCCQPGCVNDAVSEYRLKKRYCNDGHPSDPFGDTRRRFCQKHLTRGDCALEDADNNYEVVSGPGQKETNWKEANITESTQVTVMCGSIEDIPNKVAQVMKDFNN